MMFTDDDLKRLKEWASDCSCTYSEGSSPCWHQEVKALLARLEAAEKVCLYWDDDNKSSAQMEMAYQAWRKASGKTGGG